MSVIERMLTTRPWMEWGDPIAPKAIALPEPTVPTWSDGARARMNELARLEGRYDHQRRCPQRDDGLRCIRALLFVPPAEALAVLTATASSGFCECRAEPALLLALGAPALRALLAITAHRRRGVELLPELDTPWVLALALPYLVGLPTYATHHDENRDERRRVRHWLRRTSEPTRVWIRRIAAGDVPEDLVPLVPRQYKGETKDHYPNLVHCARAALRVLGEVGAPPVLLPLEHGAAETFPEGLALDGRVLGPEERETLNGWLARTEWALPDHPGLELARACSPAARAEIGAALRQRWLDTTDDAPCLLAAAIVFGGAAVAESLLEWERWPKDSFVPRRQVKIAGLFRMIGDVAPSVDEETRAALFALLAATGIDGTKKRSLWARIALREIENAAFELDAPADTLDERHLPTLGFDARARMPFAYAGRLLELTLDAGLALSVVEGTKKRASLPAARKADDKAAIVAAKARFSELRAEVRNYTDGAQARARTWIRDGQRWHPVDFAAVVRHPILGAAAQGLVWGAYERGALRHTFRLAEDRTFAGSDDNAFTLADGFVVGPVHPAELDDGARAAWSTIFHDYEIIPLVPQLDVVVRSPTLGSDRTCIEVGTPPNFYTHKVDDVRPPPGWRSIERWSLLDDEVPETSDWTKRVFGRWERNVRDLRVKISGHGSLFVAKVRRYGDYRCQWLSWDEAGALAAHEIMLDLEAYIPSLCA